MSEMIEKISGRVLFWLDAHYSGPGTAKGETECPLITELDTIKKHHRNNHCILIDDAHFFDGSHYPSLETVREKLLSINRNYNIFVQRDCILALPQDADQK